MVMSFCNKLYQCIEINLHKHVRYAEIVLMKYKYIGMHIIIGSCSDNYPHHQHYSHGGEPAAKLNNIDYLEVIKPQTQS